MSENLNLHTIDTVDTSPFKKLVMTIGELPTSFVESMSYYEALAWFVDYLQNTIIPTVNNNAEAVEELQGLFTTLYNYVHDYFDNLDVQEEINNKLDKMAEDGTLQEIITTYINSTAMWCFDSVNDMQSATNLIDGSYARTLGYYSVNDGGASIFKISDVSSNTDFCIPIANSLYAILVVTDSVNIRQLGAMGGDSYYPTASEINLASKFDTLEAAQVYYPSATSLNENIDGCAIERTIELYYNKTIVIPNGLFYINKTITPTHGYLNITGISEEYSTLIYTSTPDTATSIFNFTSLSQRNTIKKLEICGPYSVPETIAETENYLVTAITCNDSSYNTFENLDIRKVYSCIDIKSSYVTHLDNCLLHKSYYGLNCSAGDVSHNMLIEYTKVQYCHIGMYIRGGRSQAVNNCDFENDDIGLVRTNKGNISIFQCYFEDHLEIQIGQYSVDNVVIDSCSFHLLSQTSRLPFIRYHGNIRETKITVSNCLFVNQGNSSVAGPCIRQEYDDVVVSPITCTPILINNRHENINTLIDLDNFFGTIMTSQINNNMGKVNVKYINVTNNDGQTWELDEYRFTYRLAGGSGHNVNIQVPYITNGERNTREYTFLAPDYIDVDATDTITFVPENASTVNVRNAGPHALKDLRGHILKLRYYDVSDGKRQWQVFII